MLENYLSNLKTKQMELYLRGDLIDRTSYHPIEDFSGLGFTWPSQRNKLYTLIIYDKDAPYPEDSYESPYVNFLIINVQDNDILNGEVILPFEELLLQGDSDNHVIMVEVYQQEKRDPKILLSTRELFPLELYVKRNKLKLLYQERLVVEPGTEAFYTHHSPDPEHHLIKESTTLTEGEKKYCDCLVGVSGSQPGACLMEKAWYQKREGHTCYNPYAVCAHKGTATKQCSINYDFDDMSVSELMAYANLHRIELPAKVTRTELVRRIKAKFEQ
jgi:hypothetical protein